MHNQAPTGFTEAAGFAPFPARGSVFLVTLLHRYILRESLTFFGISLFAFTSVLLTLRMLQFAALVIDKGVAVQQIFQIFISIIPTFLEVALPLSTLLGIMLAFSRLSGDSEIVVMRTSGISLYRLLCPVLVFGLAACSVGLYFSQYLKPWGYQNLSQTLFAIARTKSTSGLEQGIFNKLGPLTIYAEQIDDRTGALERVLIDDRRDKEQRQIITAESGQITSDEQSRTILLFLHKGAIHQIIEGKYSLTNYSTNRISLDPNDLFEADKKRAGKQTNELSKAELHDTIAYFQQLAGIRDFKGPGVETLSSDQFPEPRPSYIIPDEMSKQEITRKLTRLKIESAQRVSLPFASFALALLALPLGIQPPRTHRTWGAGLSAAIGLLVFIFYYGFFSVGIVLAQNKILPVLVALWFPNACVVTVALFFLQRTASERWQSIAQVVEAGIDRLRQLRWKGRPA